MTDPQYHVVAATSEIAEGGQLFVELDGEEILLCRHDGKYFAVSYYCSHATFPLEGGPMDDGCISCPYHGATFDLATGRAEAPPAWEDIKTYAVRVEDSTVAISVD
jgi:3-phenylpropionate/trans-cinnamate dioxygenase ferredoxin subunit